MLVGIGSGFAQSTATLSGIVTDPSGAVVPGAHVKAHSLATSLDREAITDEAGVYTLVSLEPGDYQVQVTAAGFSLYTVQKLTLEVDQKVGLNMRLAISSAGEVVQVEGV